MLEFDVEALLHGADESNRTFSSVFEVERTVHQSRSVRTGDGDKKIAWDRHNGGCSVRLEAQNHDGVREMVLSLFFAPGQHRIGRVDPFHAVRANNQVVLCWTVRPVNGQLIETVT